MSALQTLWITRHGMRQDFVDQNWRNSAARPHDTPLSREGLQQARETGLRLKEENISVVYTSPFLRTVQTAHVIADILKLQVRIEHGICEALKPEWYESEPEFLAVDILQKDYPTIDVDYCSLLQPTYPEHHSSITFARCQLAAHAIVEHGGDNLLCVDHGASVSGVITGLTGLPSGFDCRMCALNKLVYQAGRWQLVYSSAEHLSFHEEALRFY